MTESRKLLTIVTESSLEARLVADLERLGASGYTITEGRGKGRRGVRNADWDQAGNIRLEVVCDAASAAAISAHLEKTYFEHYAMILFAADVQVLRSGKFQG